MSLRDSLGPRKNPVKVPSLRQHDKSHAAAMVTLLRRTCTVNGFTTLSARVVVVVVVGSKLPPRSVACQWMQKKQICLLHWLWPKLAIEGASFCSFFWGPLLPSLTSCTNTGLSPLTVRPKPFSSFWMITHRWTRPASETVRREKHDGVFRRTRVLIFEVETS